MNNFYTNVKVYGNNILYRGIKDGKRIQAKIPYKPRLYVPCKDESKHKTIFGENLQEMKFDCIKDARNFIKQYENVDNFHIYGNSKFEYCFIDKTHEDKFDWDFNQLKILIYDIEIDSDPLTGGFASQDDPFQPIISIAFKYYGEDVSYQLGYHDYVPPENVIYIKCKDEYSLLKKFIEIWSIQYPDSISGWDIDRFDTVYLINRCYKILGTKETNKLSPWGVIQARKLKTYNVKFKKHEEYTVYTILGISSLDYKILYKAYHPEGSKRESYALGFICSLEIGDTKEEYDGTLHELYSTDTSKFYVYNTKDVTLVEDLNIYCNLFELAYSLSYRTKVNVDDIFNQTRMGDALSYSKLIKKNVQVPHQNNSIEEEYVGGFVKSPLPGYYEWPVSVDATSLYPSIINGFGISPETLVSSEDYNSDLRSILEQNITVDNILDKELNFDLLSKNNVCLTPNGQFFRTDIRGFIPEIIEELFIERKEYKNLMLEYKKQIVNIKDKKSEEFNRLSKLITKYDSLQTATKLVANSIYGALGEKHFRFYDVRLAGAITTSGQLANRWVDKHINIYFNKLLNSDKDYVIYSDTDSAFISFEDIVKTKIPEHLSIDKKANILQKFITSVVQPKINSICEELSNKLNMARPTISYKLEKICRAGIFTRKKRYVLLVLINEGVVYSEPKLKIAGMLSSEIPPIAKEKLKLCYKTMLETRFDEIPDIVENFKNEFIKMSIDKVARSISLNGLDLYADKHTIYKKGTPFQVKGALFYNKAIKDLKLEKRLTYIKNGDKIKCVYLKQPNPLKSDVLAFVDKIPEEFKIKEYIDYNTMFDKLFLSKLKLVTDMIGVDVEKRYKLEDFF